MTVGPATRAGKRRTLPSALPDEYGLETTPLTRDPLLESRAVVHVHSIEERAAIQLDRARRVLRFRRLDEIEGVNDESSLGRERYGRVAGGDRPLAERAPERGQRVAQGVAGACLVLLRPEHAEKRVARYGAPGHGEDGEQRELGPALRQGRVFITGSSDQGQPTERDESEVFIPQHVDAVRSR